MREWDSLRSITSMQLMAQYAQERGMPSKLCLEGTGLSAMELDNPDTLVTGLQELRLASNLVRYFDDEPGLGLEVGCRYHFTSIGVLGLAIISSPTMRAALDLAYRYHALTFAFTPMSIEDDGVELRLIADDRPLPRDLNRFLLERHAAIARTWQRDMYPTVDPLVQFHFRFPAPRNTEPYVRILGKMPIFGAPRNMIVANSAMMNLRVAFASESSRRLAEEQCRKLLAARKVRTGYSEQVRSCIIRDLGSATMDTVADRLHMTQRTLRRRLLGEGTTFAALLEEVRQALAEELLATPGLTVEDVADKLGYAASSSFILAFKRWKGEPPSSYRRKHSLPLLN